MKIDEIDWTPYLGFLDFIPTPVFDTLLELRNKIVLFVSGNRLGKTRLLTRAMIYRAMGRSPYADHNIKPEDKCRVIRFASEIMPEDKEHEVKNTVYPFLKSQLPGNMLIKDITARSPVMTYHPGLGGKPGQFEFTSYGQSTQAQAGAERRVIVPDEVCPYEYYEESLPRLATTNGQFMVGCTPVEAGWMYTEIYERARMYVRTPIVRAFLLKQYGQKVKQVEKTDSKSDICVLQAATDDNPIFELMVAAKKKEIKEGLIKLEDFPYDNVSEYLESVFMYDDPDTVAMRRYGVFRQITGAVHKEFQWSIHVIDGKKYFPNGIPDNWKFARMIDYHQSVPWAIVWIALSPEDEAFVWDEMNPDPHTYTTLGICKEMMDERTERGDHRYRINLIDKLASEKQVNTNTSTTEDMNRIFREWGRLNFDKDTCWESWDDKTTKGEDKVRERLINAKICGRPLNNLQKIDGKEQRLPTLWIFDNCRETARSLKEWKMEQWLERDSIILKDPKDKKENKFSHFNKCLEAVFKDSRFKAPTEYMPTGRERLYERTFFQGRA
jgi:hypothetical protein